MTKKTKFASSPLGFVLINGALALVIVLIGVIILVAHLRRYTLHGEEMTVPDVKGMYLEVATPLLEAEHLRACVIDSTYSSKVPLGTIVEQNPPAGSHAKRDRAVYLIVNARQRKQVTIPELRDMSFRQAITTLRQLQIEVSDTLYEPSEFSNLVLDVRYNDQSVESGDRLMEGSRVTLVVGAGKGTAEVMVPNLQGLTLRDARSLLLANTLTLGTVEYDEEPTDENRENYRVYEQQPQPDQVLIEGSRVDVRLSTNLEKATHSATVSEEDFF